MNVSAFDRTWSGPAEIEAIRRGETQGARAYLLQGAPPAQFHRRLGHQLTSPLLSKRAVQISYLVCYGDPEITSEIAKNRR